MPSTNQTIAIIAGVAAVIAVAGGAYFLVLGNDNPKPAEHPAPRPAMPVATAVPPATPAVTAPSPGMADTPYLDAPGQYTVIKPTAAYVGASLEGPQMYALAVGTPLAATQQSPDKAWVISVTEDGKAAYIPTADLGPYDPSAQSAIVAAGDSVSGPAIVVNTALLEINGQQIPLQGITGETGRAADTLQDEIEAMGKTVTCNPQGDSYVCTLPNGADIARVGLFNGVARPTDDASDDYKRQAEAAKAAHKGIWQ